MDKQCMVNSGGLILNVKEDILKRYEKLNMIGEGTYGQVYRIRNKQTGEARALKIINQSSMNMTTSLPEIENMKRLDHPNIMAVYEVAQDQKNYYIVSQLCEGCIELFSEIHKRIKARQRFPEKEVIQIFKQILSAIAYAHSKNIIHRDIKPENILIEPDFHITIIDWGLSKDMSNLSILRQRIGTVDYAAPEVLRGDGYNAKCDLWSCGVILYILLSGETPFPGNATGEIEEKIINSSFEMSQRVWKLISSEAKDLLGRLLQKDVTQRISAFEALEHPWIQSQIHEVGDTEQISFRLNKLAHFCCQSKFVQATVHLMIQHFMTKDKLLQLRRTFESLDRNGDGKLSFAELEQAMNESDTLDLQDVFKKVDTDGSGYIDFTEFMAAAVDLKKLASKEKIREAFNIFDQNGDGYIQIDEVKQLLMGKIQMGDENGWKSLMEEMDNNSDGKISFEEYFGMIKKFLDCTSSQSNLSSQDDYIQEPSKKKRIKTNISKSTVTSDSKQNSESKYNLRSRQK